MATYLRVAVNCCTGYLAHLFLKTRRERHVYVGLVYNFLQAYASNSNFLHLFETLSARYRERISRHVLATIHDSSATEDIVQEVFLRIWTRAEQWHGRGSLKAWLFRIATNLALNHVRTVHRRRQQPLEVPSDPLDEDDESRVPSWMVDHSLPEPDVLVEQGERRQLLQQLIEELPEEKRAVFRLVHDAEMETWQVAQTLGIPEGTVKSRLHYATRRLAQKWRGLQHEWEDMA